MSSASSTQGGRALTVIMMDGSEFKIKVPGSSRFKVRDLHKSIAMQEHIAADGFDLIAGDAVLNTPESMLYTLNEAGIEDVLFLVAKERTLDVPDHKRCALCKEPIMHWTARSAPLCRDCNMAQVRILHAAEQAKLAARQA